MALRLVLCVCVALALCAAAEPQLETDENTMILTADNVAFRLGGDDAATGELPSVSSLLATVSMQADMVNSLSEALDAAQQKLAMVDTLSTNAEALSAALDSADTVLEKVDPLSTLAGTLSGKVATAEGKLTQVDTLSDNLDAVTATANAASSGLDTALDRIDALDTTNKDATPCATNVAGRIRYNNDQERLEYCTGSKWVASYTEPLGAFRSSAITSCTELVDAGLAAAGSSHRVWFATSTNGGEIVLAVCRFTAGDDDSIVSEFLGGDGTTPETASSGCAELKTEWNQPDGIYYIMSATTEPQRRHCMDGSNEGGDGSTAANAGKDCDTLVNVFDTPLHTSNGSLARAWLPLNTSTNVARANGFMGGGSAQLSDLYGGNLYNADEAIDGQTDDFAHSQGGTTAPYLQVRLPTMVRVKTVVVYNRPGTCASRLFAGGECDQWGSPPYTGPNEGAEVRVAQAECDGERCPGVICGVIETPNEANVYTVQCPGDGLIGNRVTLLLRGEERLLNIAELEVYGDAAKQECAATGEGKTRGDPGKTCATIRRQFPEAASGPYWIRPSEAGAFQVHCDMETLGGGWTLVEMVGSAMPRIGLYPDLGANENELIARGGDLSKYSDTMYASLGKDRVDAIWRAHGERTIVRWRASRSYERANCADYYLQRLNAPKDWSLFHAIRDASSWSDTQDYIGADLAAKAWSSGQSDTAREQFRVQKDVECRTGATGPDFYKTDSNLLLNNNKNAFQKIWEMHTVNADSNHPVEMSRHGMWSDAIGGCEWLLRSHVATMATNCFENTIVSHIWLK